MEALQYNVAQLLKEQIGATRRYTVEAEVTGMDLEWPVTRPLKGEVHFLRTNSGILVHATLDTGVELACSRCLEPVNQRLRLVIEEEFTPTVDVRSGSRVKVEEEDRALWIDDHHILDLSEVVRQGILLAIPAHVLCREDCRGICPVCGQNRNEDPCDCQEEEIDLRWEELLSWR